MYSADDLLLSIKKRGIIPADENTLNDEDILRFADEELISYVAPLIKSFNEDYFVNYEDIDLVAGQDKYSIPYRAMASQIRDCVFIDQSNNNFNMARMALSDRSRMIDDGSGSNYQYSFYTQDNDIVVFPKPSSANGKVRVFFFMRPNQLVKISSSARITNINRALNQVEVANLPTSFIGMELDFIKSKPGFQILSYDKIPTSVSGTLLTFSSLPQNLQVNDYISLAQTTPFPQVMAECHPMLSQAVVCRILDALTHTEALKAALAKLEKMEEHLPKLIGNRVVGEPSVVKNFTNMLDYSKRS